MAAVPMSSLARALQAQWRQLQQDILSPSSLQLDRRQHSTAEEDVLRVLSSLASCAETAVEDAAHTVPYLLAFAVAPLPSLKTQTMALAALRGVLSSLPGVHGSEATNVFVEDIFLGEHQALQALSLCALAALGDANLAEDDKAAAAPLPSGSFLTSLKPRGGHRSLLSRSHPASAAGDTDARLIRDALDVRRPSSTSSYSSAPPSTSASSSRPDEVPAFHGSAADLRGRVAHISLRLLNDAATMCGAVADALLSCDALLKAALRALTAFADNNNGATRRVHGTSAHRIAEDVMTVLLTLLTSKAAAHNEAALVLCSYDAPTAVCTLAHSLAGSSYNARGTVRDNSRSAGEGSSAEAAETLLWNSLKVLSWLTRECPSGMTHCLSTGNFVPTLLFRALTVPVAEIREAAALWLAALLETQAHASLQLVNDLLDMAPPSLSSPAAEAPLLSVMGALVEMLRWRGVQMRVYGVSALLCWRWMLLSHPSRVAALLQRDTSLLATVMELILRVAPALGIAADGTGENVSDADGAVARGATRHGRGGEGGPSNAAMKSVKSTTASLPCRLTALEATHILTLSYALGSLETRARLETQLLSGMLSSITLRRLRDTAQTLLAGTHPGYYDDFPLMEVKLAEPELSEGMRRAGAVVCLPDSPHPLSPTPDSNNKERGKLAVPSVGRAPSLTSVVVRLTAGGQWRQLIAESLSELTASVSAPSTALVVTRPRSPTTSSSAPSLRAAPRRLAAAPHGVLPSPLQRAEQRLVPFEVSPTSDVRVFSQAAASTGAPIHVLRTSSLSHVAAGGGSDGATSHGNSTAAARSANTLDDAREGDDDDEEHRIDIHSILAASIAEGDSETVVPGAVDAAVCTRAPRTVREATLLPTRRSTTTFRFRVVQQAEGLGGLFVQDSMRTVLQLAQHYTTSKAATVGRVTPGISPQLLRAVQDSRRTSLVRGKAKVSHLDASFVDPTVSLRSTSPSAVFGSAPRFGKPPQKERNPFAPVVKVANVERAWTVQELRREDVLLFLIRYSHLMTELPEAIGAVEDHLYFLRRQLQLCPTRDVRRRCVLNDLYMNVYPNMHLFLRFINQQARRSRGVLQMLSSLNGGTVHSGNVVEAYDIVGQCTGLSVEE
jgi:hypothetical protein